MASFCKKIKKIKVFILQAIFSFPCDQNPYEFLSFLINFILLGQFQLMNTHFGSVFNASMTILVKLEPAKRQH